MNSAICIKKRYASKVSVGEMRLLRYIHGKILQNRISNEKLHGMVVVTSREDKVWAHRLR